MYVQGGYQTQVELFFAGAFFRWRVGNTMADFLALRFSMPFLPMAAPFLLFVCGLDAPASTSMAGASALATPFSK